jgi:hypothetical protein
MRRSQAPIRMPPPQGSIPESSFPPSLCRSVPLFSSSTICCVRIHAIGGRPAAYIIYLNTLLLASANFFSLFFASSEKQHGERRRNCAQYKRTNQIICSPRPQKKIEFLCNPRARCGLTIETAHSALRTTKRVLYAPKRKHAETRADCAQ